MPEIGDYNPFEDPTKPKGDPEGAKDAKPPETPAVDHQAAIDAANKRAADAEARAEAGQKDYEKKLEEVTSVLAGRYDQKTQQQDVEPKVELTDADADKAPIATQRMVAKEEVAEALEQVGQHYGAIIGNLTEQAFGSQMEGLRAERFYDYLKDDIVDFFEKNPQGKVSPKAARTIYQQFVGQRLDELLQKEQASKEREGQAQDDLVHQRVVRPDVRTETVPRSPAARAPQAVNPKEPELKEREKEIYDIFHQYGAFEDEKDWNEWKGVLEGRSREEIPQDYTMAGRQ